MRKICLLLLLLVIFKTLTAQTTTNTDDLFKQARSAAVDQKNYPLAISLSKQALEKSPDYTDISVFLGRVYTWTGKTDSARVVFTAVMAKDPQNEDAALAFGNLEYWNDRSGKALEIVNAGLKFHPTSEDLLLLKGKALKDLRRYKEADSTLNALIKADPKNIAARSLEDVVKLNSADRVSLSYDYISFNKEYLSPWNVVEFDYVKQTSLGSIVGTVNYAKRFGTDGLQLDVDAYPHISKVFYAYVSAAYSDDLTLFPRFQGGFSLYANLPAAFEAEAGFRFLYFTTPTWVYTAAIGKYYGNFRFTLRTFLTPSYGSLSNSYSLDTRYYFGGQYDYVALKIGTGISPDSPQNILLYNNGITYRLNSNDIGATYYRTFKRNIFFASVSLEHQEYRFQTWGNQLDIGIGYQRSF
jgi:YaiO family outer membrane protein